MPTPPPPSKNNIFLHSRETLAFSLNTPSFSYFLKTLFLVSLHLFLFLSHFPTLLFVFSYFIFPPNGFSWYPPTSPGWGDLFSNIGTPEFMLEYLLNLPAERWLKEEGYRDVVTSRVWSCWAYCFCKFYRNVTSFLQLQSIFLIGIFHRSVLIVISKYAFSPDWWTAFFCFSLSTCCSTTTSSPFW